MRENLKFYKSIQLGRGLELMPGEWDKALDAYEKKDYHLIISSILRYVGKKVKDEESNWSFSHGSTNIEIKIEDDYLFVHAPFLLIEASRKIPLMRQVVQLNFSPLNLSQIKLEKDLLSFNYSCPLELCEPFKVYDVLREVCLNADSNDDQFIEKFNAKWAVEPSIVRYDSSAVSTSYDQLQEILEEALKEVAYYEEKRQFKFAWDIVAISLLKIDYLLQPQGSLRSKLEKTIGFLMSQAQIPEKISRGKETLMEIKQISLETLEKDLYAIHVFIPYKLHTKEEKLKTILEPSLAQAKKEQEADDVLSATLTLSYSILNLFYHNHMDGSIQDQLEKVLVETSSSSLKDSSEMLIKSIENLLNGKKKLVSVGRKGFLKRFFKNKK